MSTTLSVSPFGRATKLIAHSKLSRAVVHGSDLFFWPAFLCHLKVHLFVIIQVMSLDASSPVLFFRLPLLILFFKFFFCCQQIRKSRGARLVAIVFCDGYC
jgi:hypothetical protein